MYELKPFSVRVYCGSLYTPDGRIIENPSILIDGDVFLKYGEFDVVNNYFSRVVEGYTSMLQSIHELGLIRFDKYSSSEFTVKDICYILRRCMEFSASGFAEKLRLNFGTSEFLDWLRSEQERIPLQVEEI